MTDTTYNVDLLLQVRDQILMEPERHDQGEWGFAETDPTDDPHCGTTHCIAGWAAVLSGKTFQWTKRADGNWGASHLRTGENIYGYAKEALGLSFDEAYSLFYWFDRERALKGLDTFIQAGKNGVRVSLDEL